MTLQKQIFMKIIFTFILILSPFSLLWGQSFHVYDVNSEDYPVIKAKFYVTDTQENQINQFVPEEFVIKENLIQRDIRSIECESEPVFNKISTVLTIDVSGSMKGQRLDWVKNAANQWIEQIDSLNEETAITTFDDEALLYSDFQFNKQSLKESIASLEIRNGTNYKNAFLDPYAGALDLARRAEYKPIIIFLTDGVGLSDFNPKDIVKKAEVLKAVVYSISIDISLPKEMKEVSDATGGQYFENINSEEKLLEAYNIIRKIAVSTRPCEISWFTEGCLTGRIADIEFLPLKLKKQVSYDSPGEKFPEFEYIIDDGFATFECGKQATNVISMRAVNGDINVYGINKNSGPSICSDFTATFMNGKVPFVLEKDSIIDILISYNPSDSKYKICEFEIDASSCLNNKINAVSNCLNSPPSSVPISIRTPNGGEVLKANSKGKIFWDGTPQNSNIMIDYSLDSGASWNLVNFGKMYNSTDWLLPNVDSDNCLVRVKKISDNAGRKVYDASIEKNNVNKISWNKRGNIFAFVTDTNSIRLYNSITGQKINEFFFETDESPFTDVQFLPDGARIFITNSNGLFLFNLLNKKFVQINQLTGDIELSSDETIITVTNADSVSIMDVRTREILNVFKRPIAKGRISDAAISKNSEMIAFCVDSNGVSDSIYIHKKSTNWKVTSLSIMTDTSAKHSYNSLDWSFDDKYILSTSSVSDIKFIELWNLDNKKKEIKLFKPPTKISDLRSSSIENLFVTIDHGSKVDVWEIADNNGKKELKEKYNFISNSLINNTVEWSPDNTRFVIGTDGLSEENFISVYSVRAYPEYEDISDSVFAIRKTLLTINDLNLGTEYVGQTKDTTISNLITYNFDYPFIVDSVSIKSIDKNVFSVSNNPSLPNGVSNKKQPKFQFSFTPNKEATFTATLNIFSQFGTKSVNIIAKGVKPNLQLENYNFGEVLITKDSTIKKKSIKNNGTSKLLINKIYIVGPSDKYYSLLDDSENIVSFIDNIEIEPNQEFNVVIKFSPLLAKIENARLRIEYINESNVTEITHINLYGEGIDPRLELSNSINFGHVICDETTSQTITIHNKGKGTIVISDILLNSPNFTILDNFKFDILLKQNDSLSFDVRFNPIDNGLIKDSILIFTNELDSSFKKIYLNARKLVTSFLVEGNNNLIGADYNVVINETFKVINNGKTDLLWNLPYTSDDGKITVIDVVPKPTLQGDTAIVSYRFNGGNRGESYKFKFAPLPICSDSIEIKIEIKNTQPTLFTSLETDYTFVCEDSAIIKFPITNIGEEPLDITNIRFENDDASLFTINRKILNLNEGESDTLIISLDKDKLGVFSTNIIIVSNDSKSISGQLSLPITVRLEKSDFDIIEEDIQFIYSGLNNPGNKTFRIRNNGTIPIRWRVNPISNFSIISIIPQIANPNESSTVTIYYNGPNDISSENLLFVSDSCMNQDSIILNVISSGNGFAKLSLPNIERRKIGEIFNYTITLTSSNKLKESGVTSITGQLIFNHSLMRPTKNDSRIIDTERIIPFEISNLDQGSTYSIEMEALWGNDSCTTVSLDSLTAKGNTTEINLDQEIGVFCVSDLCYEGGVRLLDLSKELSISVKANNNISNQLDIELNTIETGSTEINIYDFNARKITEVLKKDLPVGKNLISKDISEIPNGVYLIEIKTSSVITYEKLIIIR